MPKFMSRAALAANRANAQKSTGPRTPQGKAASSKNALFHGILTPCPVLGAEDYPEYLRHIAALRPIFAPRNAFEEQLFDDLQNVYWLRRRYLAIESAAHEMESRHPRYQEEFTVIAPPFLIAESYRHLVENSRLPSSVNRRLSVLSREYTRLLRLYLEFHGPLEPVAPNPEPKQEPDPEPEPQPAPASEKIVTNEPIPVSPLGIMHFPAVPDAASQPETLPDPDSKTNGGAT